jgi:hypothetical protein
MKMARKLTLFLSAMALLAFAIPTFAHADAITSKAGVLAPKNSVVTGVSTNTVTTNTPVGTLECKNVTISATIDTNDGTNVAASGTGGSTVGCEAGGKLLTIDNPTMTTLTAGGLAGTTFVTLDFTATVGPVTCAYQNDSATSVPFTYVKGSDTISIKGTLEDPARPACLTPTIEGDFTLTIGGIPAILD